MGVWVLAALEAFERVVIAALDPGVGFFAGLGVVLIGEFVYIRIVYVHTDFTFHKVLILIIVFKLRRE